MPTYEFRCPDGHLTTEFFHLSKLREAITCGDCGKAAVRQIGAGSGTIFKGSGFYCNDYRKSGSTNPPSSG